MKSKTEKFLEEINKKISQLTIKDSSSQINVLDEEEINEMIERMNKFAIDNGRSERDSGDLLKIQKGRDYQHQRNNYPRPTRPDLQFEERHLVTYKSFGGDSLYE